MEMLTLRSHSLSDTEGKDFHIDKRREKNMLIPFHVKAAYNGNKQHQQHRHRLMPVIDLIKFISKPAVMIALWLRDLINVRDGNGGNFLRRLR